MRAQPPAAEVVEEEKLHHPPHEDSPAAQRMDTAMRSGDFTRARHLLHELRNEHPDPVDPDLIYREGLCLEGLNRWNEASETYHSLTPDSVPLPFRVAALLGIARCAHAQGHDSVAEQTHIGCERIGGHLPRLRAEVAFQRARLAVHHLPKSRPRPFAPDAVAWVEIRMPVERYLDWLPLADWIETSAATDPHSSHTTPHTPNGDDADTTLRTALELASDHPSVLALQLVAGNRAFLDGRTSKAIREYTRIRVEAPHSPEATAATYNLGLCLLRIWDWTRARELFTETVDRGRGTHLEYLGWWWVGRIALDLNEPALARGYWLKASAGHDREVNSAATLGEVLTRLLLDQPDQAENAFRETRPTSLDSHAAMMEVFARYFHYHHKETPNRAEELARAIRQAGHGQVFGPAGQYLFGTWLQRIGHMDDAAAVFEAAAETARGPWATRLTWEVGEHLERTGYGQAARHRFVAVAATDPGEYGDRARMRLAQQALRGGDGGECLRLCRSILDSGHVDRNDVYQLMGRSYEILGRPWDAAHCFAGRTPPTSHRDRP
jgi:tetratricopeptide (TPR) repeat protein